MIDSCIHYENLVFALQNVDAVHRVPAEPKEVLSFQPSFRWRDSLFHFFFSQSIVAESPKEELASRIELAKIKGHAKRSLRVRILHRVKIHCPQNTVAIGIFIFISRKYHLRDNEILYEITQGFS